MSEELGKNAIKTRWRALLITVLLFGLAGELVGAAGEPRADGRGAQMIRPYAVTVALADRRADDVPRVRVGKYPVVFPPERGFGCFNWKNSTSIRPKSPKEPEWGKTTV